VVVANFSGGTLNNYTLNFPFAGNWFVHLNGDNTNYGPDYGNVGSTSASASGSPPSANVTIGPYSALILSQTPDAPPQLTITQTNGSVNISWPASYFGWVLAGVSSLSGNPTWISVPANEYQTNAFDLSISLPQPSGSTFYRLLKPPD
jgi:hypothetical protein